MKKNNMPGISRKYSHRYFTISLHVERHLVFQPACDMFLLPVIMLSPLFMHDFALFIFDAAF